MILVVLIVGGIILTTLFGSISNHVQEQARAAEFERKRLLEEKLRNEEEAREAIPCVICSALPNKKLHSCRISLELAAEKVGDRRRFRDTLMDTQGRLRKCDKTHASELDALQCGNLALRKFQLGEVKLFMTSVQAPKKAEVQTPRISIGGLTADTWAAIILEYKYKCIYCGAPGDASTFHKEHKIPLARGGDNHISNIVPACAACNMDKKILTDEEYVTLRKERTEFLEASEDETTPGNALRPTVDSLPKDDSVIPAPRVAVKVGTFFGPWIEAINRLANWPTAHVVEAYSRVIDDPKKKPYGYSFNVRRDKEEHWLTNGERATYATFSPNPKPWPKNYRARMSYERLVFMCRVSQRELDALNVAKQNRKDMWIWGDGEEPISLIKLEKLVWRDDNSDATKFHLYRIPRAEQGNIKVKNIHKRERNTL